MISSARMQLVSGNMAAFETGGAGSFHLPAMKDLGQLRQLTLELADDKVMHWASCTVGKGQYRCKSFVED